VQNSSAKTRIREWISVLNPKDRKFPVDTLHGKDAAFRGKASRVQAERERVWALRSVLMHGDLDGIFAGHTTIVLIRRCSPYTVFISLESSRFKNSFFNLEK
jgi:hypothetical protein